MPDPTETETTNEALDTTPEQVVAIPNTEQTAEPADKDEKTEKKPVVLHASTPTFERLGKYFHIEKPDTEKAQQHFAKLLKNLGSGEIGGRIAPVNEDGVVKYSDLLTKIGGPIPPSDLAGINFDDPDKVRETANKTLAGMFSVTEGDLNDNDNLVKELKKKLKDEGISINTLDADVDGVLTKHLNALQDYISMRYFLGLQAAISQQEMEESINESVKNAKSKSDSLIAASKNPSNALFAAIRVKAKKGKPSIPPGLIKKLKEGKIGTKIGDGLYLCTTEDGGHYVAINIWSKTNITQALDVLKNKSVIHWTNVPKNKQNEAEIQTLQQWKKTTFDGKMTPLSETMPPKPGAWSEWVGEIDKNKTKWHHKSLKKKLVRKVVGKDKNRLAEFWQDIVNNKEKGPEPVKVAKLFKNEQKNTLKKHYQDKLIRINKELNKIRQPTPLEGQLQSPPKSDGELKLSELLREAQLKKEKGMVIKNYANLLSAQNSAGEMKKDFAVDNQIAEFMENVLGKGAVTTLKNSAEGLFGKDLGKEIKDIFDKAGEELDVKAEKEVSKHKYPDEKTNQKELKKVLVNLGMDPSKAEKKAKEIAGKEKTEEKKNKTQIEEAEIAETAMDNENKNNGPTMNPLGTQ